MSTTTNSLWGELGPEAVEDALKLAINAHHGQTRADGVTPYVFHPMRVGLLGTTPEQQIVGFLHDVVEDTWVKVEYVRHIFGDVVADAVEAITHDKSEDYEPYIEKVRENSLATLVKRRDMMDNLADKHPDRKFRRKIEKRYNRALHYLNHGVWPRDKDLRHIGAWG